MLADGRNRDIAPTELCVLAHSEDYGFYIFLERIWVEFNPHGRHWDEVNRGEYQVLCKMVELTYEKD
jgi:hypothetical protein